MDLAPYVLDLQQHLAVAAEAGGEESRVVAERLSAPLEAATRLVLLEALSAAAGEITRELAPGSVDVRLRGRDPEFVVSTPGGTEYAEVSTASARTAAVESEIADEIADALADDASTSRTTLRLPDQLKARVDQAAAAEGLSVNAWLVRAIGDALDSKNVRAPQKATRGSEHYTGWAR
jgi:predicted HicB family RNase H-like nuclease